MSSNSTAQKPTAHNPIAQKKAGDGEGLRGKRTKFSWFVIAGILVGGLALGWVGAFFLTDAPLGSLTIIAVATLILASPLFSLIAIGMYCVKKEYPFNLGLLVTSNGLASIIALILGGGGVAPAFFYHIFFFAGPVLAILCVLSFVELWWRKTLRVNIVCWLVSVHAVAAFCIISFILMSFPPR